MWQKPDQSPLEFVKQVKAQAQADVINFHGGRAGYHPELYKAHLAEWMAVNNEDATTGASDASKRAATESSCEEYLACFAVCTADNARFKELKNELDNDFLKGKDNYPKKMENALRLMQNHKSVPVKTAGRGRVKTGTKPNHKKLMMMRRGWHSHRLERNRGRSLGSTISPPTTTASVAEAKL
jgi:hypothetical protein